MDEYCDCHRREAADCTLGRDKALRDQLIAGIFSAEIKNIILSSKESEVESLVNVAKLAKPQEAA